MNFAISKLKKGKVRSKSDSDLALKALKRLNINAGLISNSLLSVFCYLKNHFLTAERLRSYNSPKVDQLYTLNDDPLICIKRINNI